MKKYKFTQKEIDEIKKEYLEKHTYIGTDKPVVLDDNTAYYVLASRARFNDYINSVHPSHNLTEWYSEVKCPASTARFYSTRKCKNCEGEQYYHAAGRFIDSKLKHKCKATIKEISEEVEEILT